MLSYGTTADADLRAVDIGATGCRPTSPRSAATASGIEVTLNCQGATTCSTPSRPSRWRASSASRPTRSSGRLRLPGNRPPLPGSRTLSSPDGEILLVDDYGHHPREIAATLDAVRDGWPERRLVLAFQPHRYTRTRDLLDDFAQVLSHADLLVLCEVYPAGETPIAGADGRA